MSGSVKCEVKVASPLTTSTKIRTTTYDSKNVQIFLVNSEGIILGNCFESRILIFLPFLTFMGNYSRSKITPFFKVSIVLPFLWLYIAYCVSFCNSAGHPLHEGPPPWQCAHLRRPDLRQLRQRWERLHRLLWVHRGDELQHVQQRGGEAAHGLLPLWPGQVGHDQREGDGRGDRHSLLRGGAQAGGSGWDDLQCSFTLRAVLQFCSFTVLQYLLHRARPPNALRCFLVNLTEILTERSPRRSLLGAASRMMASLGCSTTCRQRVADVWTVV